MSSHNHSHDHAHDHSHGATNLSFAFFAAITVNIIFVVIESVFGFRIHSLALLSDAGHNAMDVFNLIVSGLALWASRLKGNAKYTYGYKRASVFAALLNSVLLIATAVYLIVEAFDRLAHPVETVGTTMMAVATVGILVNGLSSFLLMKGSKNDINVRSAYLHLLADALVSVGVVVGGAIIYFTGYFAIDPIISIVVSVVMIWGVMDLLKTSVRMNFDGVPAGMDVSEIRKELLGIPGVEDIHDLHVWSLSTTENAMTAHVVIGKDTDKRKIKDSIRHKLLHRDIRHVTLETEHEKCADTECGQ